jgi:hypothetical protein
MKLILTKFFAWYEKYTEQNTIIAAALFATQILHLTWLTLFVVADGIIGHPLWEPSDFFQTLLIFFDYFEIPAIITTSLFYINKFRKHDATRQAVRNLIFVNSQWLHIFWITDEFVVERITSAADHVSVLPIWLAWAAIMIDYLELPVIYDTSKESIKIYRRRFHKNKAD